MACCLFFVVPCYNDADTLPITVPVFLKKIKELQNAGVIDENSRLMLVNDGSGDNTRQVIHELKMNNKNIVALNLAQNAGEQNALLAGMFTAEKKADCVITMDSDLQDDIQSADEMLALYKEGCDIVYGIRESRKEDGVFEKFNSAVFYALMKIGRTGLISQHSNFRLMSAKAIAKLHPLNLNKVYLPCVVSNLGLKSAVVYHKRFKRAAGTTGYNFKRKLTIAAEALLVHSKLLINLPGFMSLICAGVGVAAILKNFLLKKSENAFSPFLLGIGIAALLIGAVLFGLCVFASHKKREYEISGKKPLYIIDEILW